MLMPNLNTYCALTLLCIESKLLWIESTSGYCRLWLRGVLNSKCSDILINAKIDEKNKYSRSLPHPLLHQPCLHRPPSLLLWTLSWPVFFLFFIFYFILLTQASMPAAAPSPFGASFHFFKALFPWYVTFGHILTSYAQNFLSRYWLFYAPHRDWDRSLLQCYHRLDNLLPHWSLYQPSQWKVTMDHMRKQARKIFKIKTLIEKS